MIQMFKYEDMDFESLSNSPEIDPDSADAMYALAQFYKTGKGVEPNQKMYQQFLHGAAAKGCEAAIREEAANAAPSPAPKAAEDPKTFNELIRNAEDGNAEALLPAADACIRLGELNKAAEFLEQASEQIEKNAYTNEESQQIWLKLGMLWDKKGLNQPEKSHEAYGNASEMGNVQATLSYARQCREGYGCEKDEEKAERFERKGAERGNALIKFEFAMRMLAGKKRMDAALFLERAMESTRDPELKSTCLLLLASLGVASLTPEAARWAWNRLDGRTLRVYLEKEDGKQQEAKLPLEVLVRSYGTMEQARAAGLPADGNQAAAIGLALPTEEAIPWLQYAASQGNTAVCNRLGHAYNQGQGVVRDRDKAFLWFEKGAQGGDPEAQCSLGVCYLEGIGTEKDPAQAVAWFRKATEQNNANAQHRLGLCYQQGTGVEEDPFQAVTWFRKAAEQDMAAAQYDLGLCLRDGVGTEADQAQARDWFAKAAAQGYEPAREALDQMNRASQASRNTPEPPKTEITEYDLAEDLYGDDYIPPKKARTSYSETVSDKIRKIPMPLLAVLALVLFFAVIKGLSGDASPAGSSNVIDPFDPAFFNTESGVELDFTGISPHGNLIISNNLPLDNPASQIVYEANRYENITDGQKIKITATLEDGNYRLKSKSKVIHAEVTDHYLTSLDELNADSWAGIKTAMNDVLLANVGTPDENGVYGANENRDVELQGSHELELSRLYNIQYTTCALLNAKDPEAEARADDPVIQLMIQFTVDIDYNVFSRYADETPTGTYVGCIYVNDLVVDKDGNAEVDSSQFDISRLYPSQIDFENTWIAPAMTAYTLSTVDASSVLPQ